MSDSNLAYDFPIPKFRKGDKVWRAWSSTQSAQHPCPDCLGTKKWSCTSPAGHTMEMRCPRCDRDNYNDALRLGYTKHTFGVRELTIGSVSINTAPCRGDHPVSYMCEETGIGSGSIYYEDQLHTTREEAEAAQAVLTSERQSEEDATPRAMERLELSRLVYFDALEEAASKNALARLKETLEIDGEVGDSTPGNWCVERGYCDTSYKIMARTISDPYGVTVAEVQGDDSYSHLPNAKDALPNALLIAAAPDLLAALKEVVYQFDGEADDMHEARAAIAKASGNQLAKEQTP